MSLPESLERAASELDGLADQIRPANGDPHRLLKELRPEDAARLLGWILAEAPDDGGELLAAWGETGEGASVLLSVSDEGIPKAGRKLLRKARHRLRSQGIEVGASHTRDLSNPSDASEAPARRVVPASDQFQATHLSVPDFRGARMGYLVDSHPSGGARLFEVRFDLGRGILDFKIYNAGRSKVRGFLRSLTKSTAQRLFEVDRDALRALVRRASRRQPADRPLPTAFVEWRSRLFGEALEKEPTPGDLARAALGPAEDATAALESVAALIADGQIGPWPPSTGWVGDRMQKGREAVEGLEGDARASAIDDWLEKLCRALYEQSDPALLAQHLDEFAWVRWQTDQMEAARALLAASDAQASGEGAALALARARVDGLFGPFLAELRVVESSPLDESEDESPVRAGGS